MTFKLIESAHTGWRTVNAPQLVVLVRAGIRAWPVARLNNQARGAQRLFGDCSSRGGSVKFARVVRAVRTPGYHRALLRGVVPTFEHGVALDGLNPTLVLDVGANKGQFSAFALNRWPSARVVAFEPLAGPATRLSKVVGGRVEVRRSALGDASGAAQIHVASRADSSSLLALGARQRQIFHMDEVGLEKVQVERLDQCRDLFADGDRALLKIDVQGYEYEVISGTAGVASYVPWVFVEVSYQELYEGQKLLPQVQDLLAGMGYELRSLHNLQRDEHGNQLQADAFFVRAQGPRP